MNREHSPVGTVHMEYVPDWVYAALGAILDYEEHHPKGATCYDRYLQGVPEVHKLFAERIWRSRDVEGEAPPS